MTKLHTLPLVFVLLLLGSFVFPPRLLAQEGLPQPVAVGSNTAGEVNLEVPSLRYVLVGSAGESVVIQVLGLTAGFAPRFSVLNAASDVVLDAPNSSGESNVSGELLLAATGAYIIEVSGEQGSGGQFVLALQPGVPPPEPVTLVPGEIVSAVTGAETPLLIFRFDSAGLAGETLAILSGLPESGPAYRIIDEATGADVLASDGSLPGGTHNLGAQAVYRIELRPGPGAGETPFTICLGCDAATAKVEATPEAIAEATQTPAPTATFAPTATVEVCNVVSAIAGAINARSGPSTAYNMVGAIRAGQAFQALAQTESGDWYMFDLNGRDGWVSSAVARLQGGCAALPVVGADGVLSVRPTSAAAQAAGNCSIVSTYNGNANVRIGPHEDFNVLGAFTRGQTAPALARTSDGGWFMFSRNGVDAWVSSAVTRLDGDCAALASVAPVGAPAGNAGAAPPLVPAGNNVPLNTGSGAQNSLVPAGPQAPAATATTSAGGAPPAGNAAAGAGGAAGGAPAGNAAAGAGGAGGATSQLPDLRVTGDLYLEDTVWPHQMQLLGSVVNDGNAPSGPWRLRICAGNTCQEYQMPSLAPGAADQRYLTYPTGMGTMLHSVTADTTGIVAESNEANNAVSVQLGPAEAIVLSARLGVAPADENSPPRQRIEQPDLVVQGTLGIDRSATPPVLSWDAAAFNQGNEATGPWRLRLCAGNTCEEFEMPSLEPGAASETKTVTYPTGLGDLTHTAIADSLNSVVESDETNNSFSATLGEEDAHTIGSPPPPPPPTAPLPDLELITNLYFNAATNEMVWEAGAWNAGDTPTGAWTLTLCVQTCAEHVMPSLGPGAAEVRRMVYPAGMGVIPHMASVESNENVTESDTGNNYFEGNLGPDNASPI